MAGLTDTDTVDITLNSAGKYLNTQEARSLKYSDDREEYASDEIEADYMITYDNYYGVTKESDPEKYEIIINDVFTPLLGGMAGEENYDKEKLEEYAKQYLKAGGMSDEEIEKLKGRITA